MVFGPNPVDLFGWEKKDGDLLSAQDTSLSGQFVQQWTLNMMAQKAALKEVAKSKLRRLLAYNKSFNCRGVQIGDTVLIYKSTKRKSAPRWRGPEKISDVADARVPAKFHSQTSEKARYRMRGKVVAKDVEDAELDPLHARMGAVPSVPWGTGRAAEYGGRDGHG